MIAHIITRGLKGNKSYHYRLISDIAYSCNLPKTCMCIQFGRHTFIQILNIRCTKHKYLIIQIYLCHTGAYDYVDYGCPKVCVDIVR